MRKTLLPTALFAIALSIPSASHACECYCHHPGMNDPKEMERRAKVVFVGEIIAEREATQEDERTHSAPYVFLVRVERYWKGVKTPEISISAIGELQPGCCGVSLKVGQKYLVYAVGKDLSTGCTRTQHLENADEDLKALGPGKTFSK
jgi:hypothetical protein